MIQSINPATGHIIEGFAPHRPDEVDAILAAAQRAGRSWRETTFAERAAILRRLAVLIRAEKETLARVATLEMGKPIAEAEAEVEKCAWGCEFYAEHAEAFLAPEAVTSTATESYVAYRPLGTILLVMPWNFPYWQVIRCLAPVLMAGNTAILKHSSQVSRCGLEIERLGREAGLPEGVFQTVLIPGAEAERLVADDRVAGVSLTGSDGAGAAVAAAAGRTLKPTVLELGGSDPFIVLEDADLDGAIATAVRSRFQNTGQSCIAAKRFIVTAPVHDAFVEGFAAAAGALTVGDPLDRATKLGPLVTAAQRDILDRQVRATVTHGARVALAGGPMAGDGFFYAPIVLAGVGDDMVAFREETFGPVAAVIRATDADHAVALANDTRYGLGGNVWTADIERGKALAARLETGNVFVNGMTASDPRLPFGGVKRSGYGRELSVQGIRSFVNVQTVWVGPAR